MSDELDEADEGDEVPEGTAVFPEIPEELGIHPLFLAMLHAYVFLDGSDTSVLNAEASSEAMEYMALYLQRLSGEELQRGCLGARRRFYSWKSIARRGFDAVNRANGFMWRNFFLINAMHRGDVSLRDYYPLGDESWQGPLLHAN